MNHYPLNTKCLKKKFFNTKPLINLKNSLKISLSQDPCCSYNKQNNLPRARCENSVSKKYDRKIPVRNSKTFCDTRLRSLARRPWNSLLSKQLKTVISYVKFKEDAPT